jgi:post-segregation antitoxin (ccd killing protein)
MGYDATAQKRPVNMTINVDLIRKVRGLTNNLSETVEGLLASFVDAEEAKQASLTRQMEQWADASSDVVARFGCPADEHDLF